MRLKHPYKAFHLGSIHGETESVNTLIFKEPLAQAQPGQFVMIWLPGIGEKPFCVAGADPFRISVANIGDFSQALHGLHPTERVWVRGPFGQGFTLSGHRHLLIGGGYGAAPLLFLARQAICQGQKVMACLGAQTANDIFLVDEFREIQCDVLVATDDGSQGFKGWVTQAAASILERFKAHTVYACGPLPMLGAVAQICREHRLQAQLSYEALMRCGIGLCGSCELDEEVRLAAGIPAGWLTCKDGPVFFTAI